MWTKNTLKITLFVLISFLLGAGTAAFLMPDKDSVLAEEFAQMQAIREGSHSYDFVNPLLTCRFPESSDLEEYATFEKHIQQRIDDSIEKGEITDVAFYYRDLTHGRWVGVNEESGFEPASLFKVPIMMAYYRAAETDPDVLKQKIVFKPDAISRATDTQFLKAGDAYTIEELIEYMIVESDNVALNLLTANLDFNILQEMFTDLSIPYPGDATGEVYYVTPREYSLFFRVLYNGTYLSAPMSEKALELMSRATFDSGITPVLPDGIRVSHKFGERKIVDSAGEQELYELHDCGIVYTDEAPYFLCVFTRGEELGDLTRLLGDLSQLTYNEMQVLYPSKQ